MRRFAIIVVPVLVLGTLIAPIVGSRGKTADRQHSSLERAKGSHEVRSLSTVPTRPPAAARADSPAVPLAAALGDSFILAEYTFDDGFGGPDPQGWITVDVSNPAETFFHVDNFAGLSGGYAPLEGSQSLWCGARADSFLLCDYATLPGYGNSWNQTFESVPFVFEGDVTVSFLMRYDTEPNYDYIFLQHLDTGGRWKTVAWIDGMADSLFTVVIPGSDFPSTATIRFQFKSDAGWSDEDGIWPTDGAFIIDSLTVADSTGVLDFQDFESEGIGAFSTLDGDWTAESPSFGDYANLFDGATVLQQDSVVANTTFLWGFFDGSPDTYACGGFPGQPAVPFTTNPGSKDMADYLNNEIWSPLINPDEDINGFPVTPTGSMTLEFDVYLDLPLDNLVMFTWRVRSIVDGCLGEWRNNFAYYDADKEWKRVTFELFPLIESGATEFQVALGAVDVCYQLCGILGSGSCHSHGPLFDNVAIMVREPVDFIVTNTADDGPGSLRAAMLAANTFEDRNRIEFNIPGPGPHTITPLTPLPLIPWPVVIDATTQPGYAGAPVVAISGD
ncbi:MAG: hypothetical protein IH969_09710, partial [Candidatus Krumholzibacteriota bacterium]|nr:hypothetical protein [Candidatus Krumholzibacteriota bacterium]